jgi:DNA-directed RNA polymerase subunit F
MNLISKKPVTLGEAKSLIGNLEDRKVLNDYFKTFNHLSKEDAIKIAESVRNLNNLKIKEDEVIKIADFLPKSAEEVNKIFNGVGLTEEEISSIINLVKEY